ncbi:MAG: hypothetical protein K9L17_06520 [Clostridiales bacterium]|nr:hypothetical protein [Clostridiales bacterium]
MLRKADFNVTVTLNKNTIMDIEEGNTKDKLYGISFDIGTTTLVGTLVDLNSGEVKAVSSTGNPQRSYGADVISRITHCSKENGIKELKNKVISGMNEIIRSLTFKENIDKNNVYHVTAVGNTTMQHLFLGVDPTYLALVPYVPVFQDERY